MAGDFDGDFGDFAAEAGRGEAAFFSRAMDREAARRAAAAAARGDLGAAGMDPAARARIAFRRATSSMTASVSDESNNVASRPGGEPRTPRRSEGGVRASAPGLVSLVSAARRRGAADGDETRSPVSSNFALRERGTGGTTGRAPSVIHRRGCSFAANGHAGSGASIGAIARARAARTSGWAPP